MGWFNYIGLIIIIILMIPNIIYFIKKVKEPNKYRNKVLEELEATGRVGVTLFMVFNIPYSYLGYWFEGANYIYIIVNALLIILYICAFFILKNPNDFKRIIFLSSIPCIIFLFSSIMIFSILLLFFSLMFTFSHIYINIKTKGD